MERTRRLTAIIEREDDGFVALCPEVDVASQGSSIEEARANLVVALTLFFEVADESEISHRVHCEVFVTQVEVPFKLWIWHRVEVPRKVEVSLTTRKQCDRFEVVSNRSTLPR